MNLAPDPDAGADIDGHGTHVCGLIAARPDEAAHFCGIAPGVDLVTARVCDTTATTNQADMAKALDVLDADYRIDLVNLSLAAEQRSVVLYDAILDLRDAGVLAVCAAGNAAQSVWFPAALEDTIAVSAIGLSGWGAQFSISSGQRPDVDALDRFGDANFYLARFSCTGREITCAAPGVGIVSTVPTVSGDPAFAEMDGTSMASPIACAVLAARLAEDVQYRSMARDGSRASRAREVLETCCRDIVAPSFQGRGVPQV